VPEVADQGLDPAQAAAVAVLLFHLVDSSEVAARSQAGLGRRQARGEGVSLGQLEVGRDLVVELPIESSALDEGEQPQGQAA
jgi:hypothetical protein